MKTLALFTVMLASCLSWGQDYPRYEISAGYSYGSVDTQGYGTRRDAQGWSTSFITNVKKWIGMEAEVSGRYNQLSFDYQGNSLRADSPYYTFLAGPRFAHRTKKATPFIHALFGVERAPLFDSTIYDPATSTATMPFVNGFASAVGGGVDYSISRRLAFRSQADYFFSRHVALTTTPNNFRVQAAIVFTFGGGESTEARSYKVEGPVLARAAGVSAPKVEKQEADELAKVTESADGREDVAGAAIAEEVPEPALPPDSNALESVFAALPKPVAEPVIVAAAMPEPEPQIAAAMTASANASTIAATGSTISPAAAQRLVDSATAASTQQQTYPVTSPTTSLNLQVNDSNTVIISQSVSQWQPKQQEEPLGDVARRYKEKKLRAAN